MRPQDNSLDTSDFFIVAFVALVFITGAIVLFRFVRNNKRQRALRQAQGDSDLRKK